MVTSNAGHDEAPLVKKRAARNPAGWIALIPGLAGWDRDCTLCLPRLPPG